jgi:hypothetical protein
LHVHSKNTVLSFKAELREGKKMAERKKLVVAKSEPPEIYWRNRNTGGKFEPVPDKPSYLVYDKDIFIYRLILY